ncbi:MAG: YkgJ family cysteine cluster protein [Candidatus Saccharibacteria bacterium]|nr:YkgJ family cysteine cluster protein [Moraxellaceae bacterium]
MDSIIEKLVERQKLLFEEGFSDEKLVPIEYEEKLWSIEKKIDDVVSMNASRRKKIIKIQTLMSEFREVSASDVACKNGCSNCCHMQVILQQTEADAIGFMIGRKPVQLDINFKIKDPLKSYGRDTPCTFLVNGGCSIYENRPFMCRYYVNLDRDNLLCSFENLDLAKEHDPRAVSIPMAEANQLFSAFKLIN